MKLYEELNRIRKLSGISIIGNLSEKFTPEVKRALLKLDGELSPKVQNSPGMIGKAGEAQAQKLFQAQLDIFKLDDPEAAEEKLEQEVKKFVSRFKGKVWGIDANNFSPDGRKVMIAFMGKVNKSKAQNWFRENFPGVMEALKIKEIPKISIKRMESFDEYTSNPDSPFRQGTDVSGWIVTWEEAEEADKE